MPTIIGILTFISMINFMLSWVEHEIFLITSGPCLLKMLKSYIQWASLPAKIVIFFAIQFFFSNLVSVPGTPAAVEK